MDASCSYSDDDDYIVNFLKDNNLKSYSCGKFGSGRYELKYSDDKLPIVQSEIAPISSFKEFNDYVGYVFDNDIDTDITDLPLNVKTLFVLNKDTVFDVSRMDFVLDSTSREEFVENLKKCIGHNVSIKANKLINYIMNSITED